MPGLGLDFAEATMGGVGTGAVALFFGHQQVAIASLGEERLMQAPGGDGRAETLIKRAELKYPHPDLGAWLGTANVKGRIRQLGGADNDTNWTRRTTPEGQ